MVGKYDLNLLLIWWICKNHHIITNYVLVVNNGEGGNTRLKPHTQVPHLSLNPDEAKKREAVKVDFGEDEESDGSFSTPPGKSCHFYPKGVNVS